MDGIKTELRNYGDDFFMNTTGRRAIFASTNANLSIGHFENSSYLFIGNFANGYSDVEAGGCEGNYGFYAGEARDGREGDDGDSGTDKSPDSGGIIEEDPINGDDEEDWLTGGPVPPLNLKPNNVLPRMAVYPNPVTNMLRLEFAKDGKRTIELISISGVVLQSQIEEGKRLELSLKELPKGLYFLRVSEKQGIAIRSIEKL